MALRSTYDVASRRLDVTVATDLDLIDHELVLTSIVQLTPTAESGATLLERLASYHRFGFAADASRDETGWFIRALDTSHAPAHANDGPVSAFLVSPDRTTIEIDVRPMTRIPPATTGSPLAAGTPRSGQRREPPLLPYPTTVTFAAGTDRLHRGARLVDGDAGIEPAWRAISALDGRLGEGPPVLRDDGELGVRAVRDPDAAAHGYRLLVDGDTCDIHAADEFGLRHGLITLARWLRDGVPRSVDVTDRPAFSWRGLHLDLARQWFEPTTVEWLIDIAAWRKLNRLHLHLTDDEAWRMPVPEYPELAEVAGTRGHGRPLPPMLGTGPAPTGRCYTTKEIAAWVARAESLGVILIPEIDMPAHMHAALTALPWLRDPADTSGAESVQFFVDNVLVPGNDRTDAFVQHVIDAVANAFPKSPWIHIGGDEVPSGAWSGSPMTGRFRGAQGLDDARDIEARFHRDLAALIHDRHARSVGAWEEAAISGGLGPDDGYVVGWRSADTSRELATAGFHVVMAPGEAYYLDMAATSEWDEPGASWAGTTSLADVCEFEPGLGWTDAERDRLLGIQACVWTEHLHDRAALEHALFPRLDAIAERAWTGRIHGGPGSIRRRAAG